MSCARLSMPRPLATRTLAVRLLAACAAVLICACALVLLAASPQQALAKSYSMPEVTIDATLDDEGTLDVTERRTFSFSGSFTCVWWEFDSFGYNSEMTVESVELEQGGRTTDLVPVDFRPSWRNSGGPGTTCYSVDEAYDGVYVFFDVQSEEIVVTLHYKVEPMATRYSDVCELYWKFVGSEWENATRDVNLTLHLPKPADATVTVGDNVRAWAHGPLDGTVEIGDDGSIACAFPRIEPGSFAEVRTTFPTDWLAADAPVETWNYDKLSSIIDEETAWANDANATRSRSVMLYVGFFGVCMIFVIVAVVLFFKFGREYKPKFKEEYWRDVPDPKVHPLVVKYNESWGTITTEDFSTELMHLTEIGAIYLGRGSFSKPVVELPTAFRTAAASLFGQQAVDERIAQGGYVNVEDYYVAKLPAANDLRNPIDMAALDLVFGRVGGGADSVWLESFKLFGKRDPAFAQACFDSWRRTVSQQGGLAQLIEKPGRKLRGTIGSISLLIGIVSMILGAQVSNVFFLGLAVTVLTYLFIVRFMPRRSRRGCELHAKAQALEKWLKDFTLLDERLPEDVKTWGSFMVYATMFGIADQVIDALRVRLPEVYNASIGANATGGAHWHASNWGAWFAHDGFGGTSLGSSSAFSAFATSIGGAFSAPSSGSGSGGGASCGGFSGGGGGGGGGGGAR